ncbi:MAG: manganese efflux pump MntP family protein [Patescibacteria group bacterium]
MSFAEIVVLAVSLALDAAIVAVGAGALARVGALAALRIAVTFGAFGAAMPLLGFLLGSGFRDYLLAYGPIIGFALLALVGGKMLLEAFQEEDTEREKDVMSTATLIILALATSIDAFVVGITFNFIPIDIPLAIACTGAVAFLFSLAGVYAGRSSKHRIGNRIEIIGGLVLIALAFKTLLA